MARRMKVFNEDFLAAYAKRRQSADDVSPMGEASSFSSVPCGQATMSLEEFNALKTKKRGKRGMLGNVQRSQLPVLHKDPTHVRRILGIDTSLRSTGLAVIEVRGNEFRYLDARPIKNKASLSLPECLVNIRKTLLAYIEEYQPEEVAMEGIFYCRNAKTSLILGHARGVVVEVCAEKGLPISEYSPTRVKQAVTGYGFSVKEQMQIMMQRLFKLEALPQEDAADALAIALTHSRC